MDRALSGFSLIELLVIIAIISIMMGFSVNWYIKYEQDRKLTEAANSLVAELQWAKEHSISGENIYGVYIDTANKKYVLFKNLDYGCSFNNQTEELRTKVLANGLSFEDAQPKTFLFDRRGYPLNSSCGLGMDTITLKNRNNNIKKIVISRYGRFKIE